MKKMIFFEISKMSPKNKFRFSKLFFSSKKMFLRKILDIKIDVKFYRESISGIHSGIRALPEALETNIPSPEKKCFFFVLFDINIV